MPIQAHSRIIYVVLSLYIEIERSCHIRRGQKQVSMLCVYGKNYELTPHRSEITFTHVARYVPSYECKFCSLCTLLRACYVITTYCTYSFIFCWCGVISLFFCNSVRVRWRHDSTELFIFRGFLPPTFCAFSAASVGAFLKCRLFL